MKAKLITVLFLICLVNIQPMLQGMGDSGGAGEPGTGKRRRDDESRRDDENPQKRPRRLMGNSGGAGERGRDGASTPDICTIDRVIKAGCLFSESLLRFLDANDLNSLRLVNNDLCQAVDAIYQTLHVKRVNEYALKRARKIPHITSLRVSDLEPNPEMLAELIKNCPNLKALNLNHCPRSGEGLVEALTDLSARGCLQLLEELYLYYTGVTEEHIDALRELLQNCEIFYRL